jgi:benzoate 4-monooxygenase
MQNLPYLDACIKERLRIHSTIAIDLPHVSPEGKFSAREDLRVIIFLGAGGLVVCGRFFFAGSVVGVPIYTLHRCGRGEIPRRRFLNRVGDPLAVE